MKILAVIVAYNPETNLIRKNIASFVDDVDKVLVWRNSSMDEALIAEGFEKIEFCGDCSNAGIPKALNYAWRYAGDNGFTHLLTMDQDSVWENFKGYLSSALAPNAPQGIFGPRINGTMGYEEYLPADYQNTEIVTYPFIITSGMLVSVPLLDRIGGWDESMFVDGVDMEFVFHARELGIFTYRVAGCNLVHRLGNTFKKRFLGRAYTVHNYSPARLYGLYSSHIMVMRKYPSAKIMKPLFRKQNYRQRPIRILLGEKNKCAKIAAIIRGIRDGRRATI